MPSCFPDELTEHLTCRAADPRQPRQGVNFRNGQLYQTRRSDAFVISRSHRLAAPTAEQPRHHTACLKSNRDPWQDLHQTCAYSTCSPTQIERICSESSLSGRATAGSVHMLLGCRLGWQLPLTQPRWVKPRHAWRKCSCNCHQRLLDTNRRQHRRRRHKKLKKFLL